MICFQRQVARLDSLRTEHISRGHQQPDRSHQRRQRFLVEPVKQQLQRNPHEDQRERRQNDHPDDPRLTKQLANPFVIDHQDRPECPQMQRDIESGTFELLTEELLRNDQVARGTDRRNSAIPCRTPSSTIFQASMRIGSVRSERFEPYCGGAAGVEGGVSVREPQLRE